MPARDNIKIAAMWIEAFQRRKVKEAGGHFLMARDELGFTTIVGKRPYDVDAIEKFRKACQEMSWETEWFPGKKPNRQTRPMSCQVQPELRFHGTTTL